MKQSILSLPRPFVCALVKEDSLDKNILRMREAAFDGAQALGIHMRFMHTAEKNDEGLRRLMSCTSRPVMAIHYRDGVDKSLTDEDRADILLRSAKAGASMIDVMGDLYDKSDEELTHDPAAIDKQMKLIDQIHETGSEVIMSSHVLDHHMNTDQVMEHMYAKCKRGIDLPKLVNLLSTEEELIESVQTLSLLKKELGHPFVYIGSGPFGMKQRLIAPLFGEVLFFAMHPFDNTGEHVAQFPVRELVNLKHYGYDNIIL